jgi:hypothetical protein
MPYNQDRLDQPVNLDLFSRNRQPSNNTPIIELDTAGLDGASTTALAAANVRAMRSAANSPARCAERMGQWAAMRRGALAAAREPRTAIGWQ